MQGDTLEPAFRVPITLPSIGFDVLGAYTFVKMADNLGKYLFASSPLSRSNLSHRDSWFIGYPICPTTPALVAGAVFGALFFRQLESIQLLDHR
jgi:hypothetical protein